MGTSVKKNAPDLVDAEQVALVDDDPERRRVVAGSPLRQEPLEVTQRVAPRVHDREEDVRVRHRVLYKRMSGWS